MTPKKIIVRWAIESACLAHWCAGLYSEDLLRALDACDREDWASCGRAAWSAVWDAAGDAAGAAAGAAAKDAAWAAAWAAARDAAWAAAGAARDAAWAARAAAGAAAGDSARACLALRLRALLGLDHDASALRLAVAAHIEAHPELHDQREWGDGDADPGCRTPCCVAGWACHLGGGSLGLPVELAAVALLALDGATLPSFAPTASREAILRDLRAS